MAKLISLSIDVTKIGKDKLIKGEKGTYANLTIALNDEEDKFGNNVSCWLKQDKDDKSPKQYLGNGKVFWSNDGSAKSQAESNNNSTSDDLPW